MTNTRYDRHVRHPVVARAGLVVLSVLTGASTVVVVWCVVNAMLMEYPMATIMLVGFGAVLLALLPWVALMAWWAWWWDLL